MTYINDFLEGHLLFEQFEDLFQGLYVELVPHDALSSYEEEFFSEVQEQLDWTSKEPDALSRSYGWISQEEYLVWLRRRRKQYLAGLVDRISDDSPS